MKTKITQLVIVEDDFVDAEALRRGVSSRGYDFEVKVCHEGNSALEFLRTQAIEDDNQERRIVLLDINMPGMNGHEFLQELRSDPALQRTIVFVLTNLH